MKEALRTSGLANRMERGLVNVLLGLPVVLSLSRDPFSAGGVVGLLLLLGIFGVGAIEIVSGMAAGTAVTAALVALNEIIVPQYQFGGTAVAVCALTMGVSFVTILTIYFRGSSLRIPALGAGVFAALYIGVCSNLNSYDSNSFFSLFSNTNSSYSQALSSLAQSIWGENIHLVPESSGTSGPLLGSILVIGRVMISWLDPRSSISITENATVLGRLLVAIVAFNSAIWFCIGSHLLHKGRDVNRSFVSVIFALSSAVFSLGIFQTGRVNVLIAYLFVSLATLTHIARNKLKTFKIPWPDFIVAAFLLLSGLAWLPALGYGVAYLVGVTSTKLLKRFRQQTITGSTWKTSTVFYVASTAIVISSIVIMNWIWQVIASSVTESTRDTMPGGMSAIHPFMVIATFSIAIWLITRIREIDDDSTDEMLKAVLVVLPVVLIVISYFVSPYIPVSDVGIIIYLSCALLAPIIALQTFLMIQREVRTRTVKGLTGMFLMAYLVLVPLPQILNVNELRTTVDTKTVWAKTVLAEYAKTPQRPIVCLNTLQDDVSGDAAAQLCSRMALHLGGFTTDEYEAWIKATGCTITGDAPQLIFSRQMLENLTVILSDATRTSSFAGCQSYSSAAENGWLTDIDWSLLRKIDVNGAEVYPRVTKGAP